MIDLKNLDRWRPVPEDGGLLFPNEKPRRVRLEVNSAFRAKLYCVVDETPIYLQTFEGYGVLAFVVPGKFTLVADQPGVCVYSAEFERMAAVIPDAVVFTKIAQRRARNPELESLMQRVTHNMDRQLAAMGSAFERRLAEVIETKEKAVKDEPKRKAAASVDKAKSESASDSGESGESVAAADVSAETGDGAVSS